MVLFTHEQIIYALDFYITFYDERYEIGEQIPTAKNWYKRIAVYSKKNKKTKQTNKQTKTKKPLTSFTNKF